MSFVIVPWIPKKGYHVQFRREPVDGSFHHIYGGTLDQPDSTCPHCGTEFLRYLCLDTSDPRLEMEGLAFARLPLCFCPKCILTASGSFSYRVREDSTVEWIQCLKGADGPPPQQGIRLPDSVRHLELEPIPDDVQAGITAHLCYSDTREDDEEVFCAFFEAQYRIHIGGPAWGPQDPEEFECPGCGAWMAFVGSAVDDGPDGICIFDDCACVLGFYFCPSCAIVTGQLETD